jgi:hypothetical protein
VGVEEQRERANEIPSRQHFDFGIAEESSNIGYGDLVSFELRTS